VHHVADIDAVRDRTRVEHDQFSRRFDVDCPADELTFGQLDTYFVAERGEQGAVSGVNVARERIERSE
jgi:hypothetical protein